MAVPGISAQHFPTPDYSKLKQNQNNQDHKQKLVLEDLLNTLLIYRPGGGGRKGSKITVQRPSIPSIGAQQANVSSALLQHIANMLNLSKSEKLEKKERKKTLDETLQDVEEAVNNCLHEIASNKTPITEKNASKREELLRMLQELDTAYDYIADESQRVKLSDTLYNVLCQPEFSSGKQDMRSALFELPPGQYYSNRTPLINDVVFAFIIHSLVHPTQNLRPYRAIKKAMGPLGLPDIADKLQTFNESDQQHILTQIILLGADFPFSTHLPQALGSNGLDVIICWYFDLLEPECFQEYTEKLEKIFGEAFRRQTAEKIQNIVKELKLLLTRLMAIIAIAG